MAERNQSHSEHATTRNGDESVLLSGEERLSELFKASVCTTAEFACAPADSSTRRTLSFLLCGRAFFWRARPLLESGARIPEAVGRR